MPRRRAPDRRVRAGQQTLATSFPRLLQMRFERGELAGPERIRFGQPGLELHHRLWPQPIDADARIELVAVFLHQATLAQSLEMPAHRRKGDARRLRELPRPMGPFAQEVDDSPAMRICQRRQRLVEGWRAQRSRSNLNPVAFSISWLVTSRTGCANVQ